MLLIINILKNKKINKKTQATIMSLESIMLKKGYFDT